MPMIYTPESSIGCIMEPLHNAMSVIICAWPYHTVLLSYVHDPITHVIICAWPYYTVLLSYMHDPITHVIICAWPYYTVLLSYVHDPITHVIICAWPYYTVLLSYVHDPITQLYYSIEAELTGQAITTVGWTERDVNHWACAVEQSALERRRRLCDVWRLWRRLDDCFGVSYTWNKVLNNL